MSLWLCWTLLSVGLLLVSAEQKNITAESGQDVTLTCRAPSNKTITGVEWSRADLETDYVFLHQDGQSDPNSQHPSFQDRVDLQDHEMKDGDVSLILKNVTAADEGKYECRVIQRGTNRRRRAHLSTEPTCIIHLSVVAPPGRSRGLPVHGGKGLVSVCLQVFVVLIVVVSFVILIEYKERRRHQKRAAAH